MASSDSGGLSAAQRLQQQHENERNETHKATIEDVPDEEDLTRHPHPVSSNILESTDESATGSGWGAPMSSNAAGKQKETVGKEKKPIDTQSEALFPGLGGAQRGAQITTAAPIWAKQSAPVSNGNGTPTNGSSIPTSRVNTPPIGTPRTGGAPSLAGQVAGTTYTFGPKDLPRSGFKKPLPDILSAVNKKYRTNLTQTTGEGGILKLTSAGTQIPESVKRQAFKEVGSNITTKTSNKVAIPRSARAHIIGKGGATIKSIQEGSGARIQFPKTEDIPAQLDEDDDEMFIMIEGNPIAVLLAKEAVGKIASERVATVNTKLRTIPAELYPFISGSDNARVNALEQAHNVQIRVPQHHVWTEQAPPQVPARGELPAFLPAFGDNNITLAGDRSSVNAARAEIERLAQELQQQLTLEQAPVDRGRHQFIIGSRGLSPQDFHAETGCAIILPGDDDDDVITVVGPADQISAAMDKAYELAMGMQVTHLDLVKQLRNIPSPADHARNLTHYLRDREEIARIEKFHQAHVVTPFGINGVAQPWELYARDGKNSLKAQGEIRQILEAHPPSRVTALDIDDFFHKHLQKEYQSRLKTDFGVHLVIPKVKASPVVLVFEGTEAQSSDYAVPRGQPGAAEIKNFQQNLAAASKHILDSIAAQGAIIERRIEVPQIFHAKLQKYILKENQAREAGQFPVRVFPRGPSTLSFSGPKPAVESLVSKVQSWVEQAQADEKERGFTLSFDFPQKHANQLIGKGGSNISELREKFDVDIQVNDGIVELKGPKAKAEAAKSHITGLGKAWADEATYVLKIEPKYHSELIGAGGAQIKKLERKYKNVQIRFPHSARAPRDDQSNAESDSGKRGGRNQQEPDEVIIRGPKKGADEVKSEILDLLQYTKDNSHSAAVSVQAAQIPSLIGQRGAEMDKVRQETGAKIDIPNARDIQDPSTRVEIQIKGTKSQVAQAKKLIEEKKIAFDNTVTKSLEVEKKHHRALIGAKGATIGEIVLKAGGSNSSGQTVQFPKADADGNLIKVTGTNDVVDKIIATIESIVADLESRTTEVIDVPTEKHRSLIGRGGDTKRELESTFKVSIDIPRQGSDSTDVRINGLPDDVEKAKAHILSLVKEQEGESIQVPRSVHHFVSDNGQFFRQLRNSHKVTVDVNRNDVPPTPPKAPATKSNGAAPLITDEADESTHQFSTVDLADSSVDGDIPWVLRGAPDNIEKARSLINTAIEQALKNTTIGYLSLPDPQTYRFVIGQGGSKVNNIRKASGCKITVPRNQAADEAIEIVGSAEGVEHARDLILQAVIEGQNNTGGGRS